MAEEDTILRAAQRIERAISGQELKVRAAGSRGRAAWVERLDGRHLDRVESRGKHLLLHLGDLVLHSPLAVSRRPRAEVAVWLTPKDRASPPCRFRVAAGG